LYESCSTAAFRVRSSPNVRSVRIAVLAGDVEADADDADLVAIGGDPAEPLMACHFKGSELLNGDDTASSFFQVL